MNELRHAESFRDLLVYQKATAVSRAIFELSKGFPGEETFSLADQIRRAVRSIGAQIAEAWAKRRYERHFVSKLSDADGEQTETQHWLSEVCNCEYIESAQAEALVNELEQIGRMLNSMMVKSHLFCSQNPTTVCEAESEYLVQEDH